MHCVKKTDLKYLLNVIQRVILMSNHNSSENPRVRAHWQATSHPLKQTDHTLVMIFSSVIISAHML